MCLQKLSVANSSNVDGLFDGYCMFCFNKKTADSSKNLKSVMQIALNYRFGKVIVLFNEDVDFITDIDADINFGFSNVIENTFINNENNTSTRRTRQKVWTVISVANKIAKTVSLSVSIHYYFLLN